MKKPSIYPDRSQELLTLFEGAGNQSKLMCVPIDYAKKDHLVMFCNGNGDGRTFDSADVQLWRAGPRRVTA